MAKKLLGCLVVLLTGVITLSGCSVGGSKERAPGDSAGGKIVVYTTIFPLFDFTRNIAGDRAEVVSLLPLGADPHHWEPAPGDLVKLGGADVFVYCGAGLESWVEGALKNSRRGKMIVVDSSRGVKLMEGGEGAAGEHRREEKAKDKHGHHHGAVDPHIWLDPVNAAVMVDNILAGLIKADPANSDFYTSNAQKYKERLTGLDIRYRSALEGARVKKFVVSHDAFGYMAARYGLEQVPIRGLTADAEPGPARMAEIADIIRTHRIKYVFFETLASPKVSEALARETGAGTLMLNPAHGLTDGEMALGKDYITIMEENLKNLKKACEVE